MNATDSDGSVSKVEFFSNGQKLGEDSSNPYNFSFTTSTSGNFDLTATATDNNGATGNAAAVMITVTSRATPPPPPAPTGNLSITQSQYNEFFPYRFGTDPNTLVLDPNKDFYTYDAFKEAVNRMSKIEVTFERRRGTNLYRLTRRDKSTGQSRVIRTDQDFDADWNQSKEIVRNVVDYGTFANEGSEENQKRELAAFLANIAQETTGVGQLLQVDLTLGDSTTTRN